MWIDKKEKYLYNDCKYHGIRIRFYKEFPEEKAKKIRLFCRWLSSKFWFPIRCNLTFVWQKKFKSIYDGHYYYGIFYDNEGYKKYPCICVATEMNDVDDEYSCYYIVVHELTHYFQWYFYDVENKTNRSLEIMANKWARYIVGEYFDRCKSKNRIATTEQVQILDNYENK